jgi:hypothetical protein
MGWGRAVLKIVRTFGVCLLLLAGLGACAVGNHQQYAGVVPDLKVTGQRSVAVAVVDNRPYVVDGDKDPDFVGVQRAGFGNPFDVGTDSRKPLATDMTDNIVAALKQRGLSTEAVTVKPGTPSAAALQAATGAGKERALILELREWKSDTYTNTALIYDVELWVCDATGKPLATVTKKGDDDLGGDFMDPPGHAKDAVPPKLKAILEGLLNAPEIVAALQ